MARVVGRRAVIMVLLAVLGSAGVVAFWPQQDLPHLDTGAGQTEAARTAELDAIFAEIREAETPLERQAVATDDEEELDESLALGAPTAEQRDKFGDALRALLDDNIPGNAGKAMRVLRDPDAAPLLYEALDSPDRQQRLLAAVILMGNQRPPTARLAEVLVELMTRESHDYLRRTVITSPAKAAARYLYHHPAHSRPTLRRALWAGEESQRFLAAFLLGCDGSTQDLEPIVRELIGHLADNHTTSDGMMAAHALFRLGPKVAPVLRYWLPNVDEQAQQFIRLILLDLEDPPITRADFLARQRMHRVTDIYHDPVVQFSPSRSSVATR